MLVGVLNRRVLPNCVSGETVVPQVLCHVQHGLSHRYERTGRGVSRSGDKHTTRLGVSAPTFRSVVMVLPSQLGSG